MKQKYKIFLSLTEIAGYYSLLAKGFKELNINSNNGFVTKHIFNYQTHYPSFLQKILTKITGYYQRRQSKIVRLLTIPWLGMMMLFYFIEALFKYNVFIFSANQTFFPKNLDLPILKFFNKKIIIICHGSDVRPPYLNGIFAEENSHSLYKKTLKLYKRVRNLEKFANYIIAQPAHSMFFSNKNLVNWLEIGMPCAPETYLPKPQAKALILHSPSKPKAKGTLIIRQAVEELKQEGFVFEYQELQNTPNKIVKQYIQQSAFVIDQLYSDIPLSGFGAEAAALRKISIIGGYELKKLTNFITDNNISYQIEPTVKALKNAIKDLLTNPDKAEQMGQEAYDFVVKNWHYKCVARKIIDLLENKLAPQYYFNSHQADFIYGCCISDNNRQKIIKNYLMFYSPEKLMLSPHLTRMLLASLRANNI
jgi:glycosyltransferase involved in cell wall biosynthesis